MKFTFGIITSGNFDKGIDATINTIENLDITEYEVLIVGNSEVNRKNTKVIEFDETVKKSWITRKKNLVTKNAKYDNIVYAHDYIIFEPDWYMGYLKYGEDFKVCMNRVLNVNRSRWHDWLLWPHNENFMDDILYPNRHCLIPYDMTHLSKFMYISGAYWVAKKSVMEEFPLNEELVWGEGEDTEWSFRVREKYDFSMNKYSTVRTMKPKTQAFSYANAETISILNRIK